LYITTNFLQILRERKAGNELVVKMCLKHSSCSHRWCAPAQAFDNLFDTALRWSNHFDAVLWWSGS